MTTEHPTAADLWSARTAVSITVGHAHRQQADADRDLVEKLTRKVDVLTRDLSRHAAVIARVAGERDAARAERDMVAARRDDLYAKWVGTADRSLVALADIQTRVEDLTAERDRARDLAVRAGAFDGDRGLAVISQLQEDVDTLCSELEIMQRERDQALYERDTARSTWGSHGA